MEWNLPVPSFSGDAGIGQLVAEMRDPAYVRLLGKGIATGVGAGLIIRRLPPQVAAPVLLLAGIYFGLEMAAYLEEDAISRKGPIIDATATDGMAAMNTPEKGSDLTDPDSRSTSPEQVTARRDGHSTTFGGVDI